MPGDAEAGLVFQNKLWPAHVQTSLSESGHSGARGSRCLFVRLCLHKRLWRSVSERHGWLGWQWGGATSWSSPWIDIWLNLDHELKGPKVAV